MPAGFYSRAEIEQIVDRILGGIGGRGKVFYVDPDNGSNGYDGRSPGKAKASTQAAVNLCQEDRGDVIIRLPGTEQLGDGVLELNVRGIHLIGLPNLNPMRPELCLVARFGADDTVATGDATGPAAIVTKPCEIAGMAFYADWTLDEGVAYPGQSGADLELDGEEGGFAGNFCHIHHCEFPGWGESGGIFLWAGSFNLIEECSFTGLTFGIKLGPTTSRNPTDNQIRRNRFAGCTYGIDGLATGTYHNMEVGPENTFYSNNAKAMTNAIRTRDRWNYGLICRNCIGLPEASAFDKNKADMEAQHVYAVCNCYTDGTDPRT